MLDGFTLNVTLPPGSIPNCKSRGLINATSPRRSTSFYPTTC